MPKIFILLVLSCFSITFLSCKKDTGDSANAGGTSIYSFQGSPSTCSAPVIAGIYSVGTTLTSANTITLSVNVTATGTYSIYTTAANGVWFSGGGVFPATGLQAVVLTGNGTPERTGNFPFVPFTSNTCNFTVSFSAGGPSAVFTYAGAPGNCTAPAVSGTYSSGISLGAGNYVDLAVNVTTAGGYTIITNNSNGISFSGSGVFTATGAQVVRLIGNGTPTGAGSFAFTPSGGCSFNITVTPPAPPATFTYNGAPGSCTTPGINGTYAAGTALNATNSVVLSVNVSVIGSYSVSTNNSNGVVFSGSGNFTTAGANTITLRSTNTPTAGGTFTYTPTGGCSFDIVYAAGPPPPADFLKCTIDGTFIDFNVGVFAILSGGSFSATGGFGSSSLDVSLNDMSANIAVGTYNKFSLTNMNKYCLVTYTPNTGSPGSFWLPSPTNSNPFTVTVQTLTATKVTGIFSGDLFDAFGANKKVVTAGSFSVTY